MPALHAPSFAPLLCKAVKTLEEREVSCDYARDFHKLINTCVEIFTELKYRLRTSAALVLSAQPPLLARK
jgi:hypothetical protein